MKVRINCNITTEADTFKDALELLKAELQYTRENAACDSLESEYNFWNDKNEGDVDWTPYSAYPYDEKLKGGKDYHTTINVKNIH